MIELAVELAGDHARIMAAEPKGIVHDGVDLHLAGSVRHIIKVALGIRLYEIDGRRNDLVLDGLHANRHLNRPRSAEHMTGCAFGGTDGDFARRISKNCLDRLCFTDVTLWR